MSSGGRKWVERSKRVPFRFIVRYGTSNPPQYSAVVADMSETGVHISTNKVFKPGVNLYMTIEIDEEFYDCEGVVSWAKKVEPRLVRVVRCGMGVRFTKVPPELMELYKRKLS